jgi:hypothetical protein
MGFPGANRRGFALPLMLAVLAVGSILLAGAIVIARLEVQSGRNALRASQTLETAELGLGEITAWWDPAQFNHLPVTATQSLPARTFGSRGYTGALTRLSSVLFEVNVEGWFQGPSNLPIARRILRSLVRLEGERPLVSAALTVIDTLSWDGASTVSGHDTIPPGWEPACVVDSSMAGLATPPTAYQGPGVLCPLCAHGSPPFIADTSLSLATLTGFGRLSYAGLAARASFTPSGLVGPIGPAIGGQVPACQISDSLNWGEPRRTGAFSACALHFPVIHSPQNLVLTSGRGQGILLVDGDLELRGGFEFTGLVIVLGTLRNGPGGGAVLGAVLARSVALDHLLSASPLDIRYSACVLPTSMSGTSLATPLPYRSWAQVF